MNAKVTTNILWRDLYAAAMLELDRESIHARRCFRLAAMNGEQGFHTVTIAFVGLMFSASSVIVTIWLSCQPSSRPG